MATGLRRTLWMKKFVLTAAAIAAVLSGCAKDSDQYGLKGTVNTDGSTSMADVMAVLQETFREMEPGVTVNISGTGSGSGIEAALSGACDIGLSSRALKSEEEQKGAVAHVVALDGIAVVVHPSNPVADLTVGQIAGIFTGKLSNWKELGGGDAPIAVYGREAGSGTRGAFEDIMGIAGQCAYTNEYGSTGDVVGSVSSNPNAIGYASLSTVNETVSAIKVGGAACTEEAIQDGSYAIQRPFLMVTRKDTALSEAAQAFLSYSLSREAAQYIAKAGVIVPERQP